MKKLFILILIATSCTVAPKIVKPRSIEFNNNSQNAGVLGTNELGLVILSAEKVQEYNSLINLYGTNYLVPPTNNFGITPYTNNTYLISNEGLFKFLEMKSWHRNR